MVEGEAANRAIMIADMAGSPLYVVHVSCRESAEPIAKQKWTKLFGDFKVTQTRTIDAVEARESVAGWGQRPTQALTPWLRSSIRSVKDAQRAAERIKLVALAASIRAQSGRDPTL